MGEGGTGNTGRGEERGPQPRPCRPGRWLRARPAPRWCPWSGGGRRMGKPTSGIPLAVRPGMCLMGVRGGAISHPCPTNFCAQLGASQGEGGGPPPPPLRHPSGPLLYPKTPKGHKANASRFSATARRQPPEPRLQAGSPLSSPCQPHGRRGANKSWVMGWVGTPDATRPNRSSFQKGITSLLRPDGQN